MASIPVRIPTNAIMPKAMMSKVSTERSMFALIFLNAWLRISEKGTVRECG
jgi:hypothetical protein